MQARGAVFASYGRVSSRGGREDDRFHSPELQLEANELFAKREGLELRVYGVDVDAKGSSSSRKILDVIKRDIAAGELAGIVVPKLDRLSRLPARERLELVDFIEQEHGGRILSATEPNDVSTPEGRFVRELFLMLARMEWEQKAQGFERAREAALEKGIPIMRTPYGYRLNEERRLEVEPAEAELMRTLFERRAEGDSYRVLLELFRERTGRKITHQSMWRMLQNRVYLGELRHGSELSPVRHEPLVSEELFAAAQGASARRSRGQGRDRRRKSLLAGIAKCSACGRSLAQNSSRGGRYAHYRCTYDHCTGKVSIQLAALEAYVLEQVLAYIGPRADELVEVELELAPVERRLVLEQELSEARAAIGVYLSSPAVAKLPPDRFEQGLEARLEQERRLEHELAELVPVGELARAASTLRRALDTDAELSTEERRELLAVIVDRVEVFRGARINAPVASRVRVLFTDGTEPPRQDRLQPLQRERDRVRS